MRESRSQYSTCASAAAALTLALFTLTGFIIVPPRQGAAARARDTALSAAAVASRDLFGDAAAQEILAAGGNAVDAAVAMQFALAVTLLEELRAMGYTLDERPGPGDVQAIHLVEGAPRPASDPRGRGKALVITSGDPSNGSD